MICSRVEREILQLLAEGKSNKEVASLLNLSTLTVETHRANLMQKVNLHNTAENCALRGSQENRFLRSFGSKSRRSSFKSNQVLVAFTPSNHTVIRSAHQNLGSPRS